MKKSVLLFLILFVFACPKTQAYKPAKEDSKNNSKVELTMWFEVN